MSAASTFLQSDLFLKGVPQSRVNRHGAPVHKPAVQKGRGEVWRTVFRRFRNGQSPNQYDYAKLEPDEIRLLQLRPALNAGDQIICIMFKAKRKDVINKYEALSYTWGDMPKIHHPILIDDKNPPVQKPRTDLFQAIARVGAWQDKVKRLKREERKRELEKILEDEKDREDREEERKEWDTLEEFRTMDEAWEQVKKDWEKLKADNTIDPKKKSAEQDRLAKRRNSLIDKAEELEKRYNDISRSTQAKNGLPVVVDMITERRKKILDQSQQTPVAPQSTIQEFHVRPNLYAALVHLRRAERPVNLWVDAICINQQKDGEKEKEEQLSVMAQIYGNASNVCIWLGDSDVQLKAALNFANRMMDFSQLDSLFDKIDSKPLLRAATTPIVADQNVAAKIDNELAVELASDLGREQWYYLMRLLRLPWFSRRWIIQEIGMAKNASVHLGADIIHWDDLCDAINLLNEKADDLRDKTRDHDEFGDIEGLSASTLVKVIGNACRKNEQGAVTVKMLGIETLVCSLLAFDSFHAYDAIYSLLSLAADVEPDDSSDDPDFTIKANFKRSTRDLFISFVRRSIVKTNSLDIICRHWAPVVKNEINEIMLLPSWVSSMDRSPFGPPSHAHGRQHGENFVAFDHGDTRKRYNASADIGPKWSIEKLSSSQTPLKKPQPVRVGSTIAEEPSTPFSPTRNGAPPVKILIPEATGKSLSDMPIVGSPTFLPQDDPMKQVRPSAVVDFGIATAGASRPVNGQADTPPKTSQGVNGVGAGPVDLSDAHAVHQPPERTSHPPRPPALATPAATPASANKQSRPRTNEAPPPTPGPAGTPRRGTTVSDKKDKLSGILSAEGFCIGTIEEVSGPMDSVVNGQWVRKLGWKNAESNANHVPDKLWRTLVADRGPDGSYAPHWYRRACLHVLADPKITDGQGYIKVSKYATRILGDMTARYLRRVDAVTMKRCIFFSESDLVNEKVYGLAPEDARFGDHVCILFGCSVPVILRPITAAGHDDQGHFELVGEAYVHGKMQGEAVKEWKKTGKAPKTFHIA